jgi:hypothetical protein
VDIELRFGLRKGGPLPGLPEPRGDQSGREKDQQEANRGFHRALAAVDDCGTDYRQDHVSANVCGVN